jgi:hypothetical protein
MKPSMALGLATLAAWYGTDVRAVHAAETASFPTADPGLIGYWKLQGDCRDYSGQQNNGINHGVDLARGQFDGIGAYVEVPASASLRGLGSGDFAFAAWVSTERDLDDVVGDILDWYDPVQRRGVTLSVISSGSGYQGQGDDRRVCFGIDNGRLDDWEDCGRPSPTSRYISNSMLVFRGNLYAAITDAKDEKDWCHVFRYDGKRRWTDCGRVGRGRTTGVGPLVVHRGALYAVTWTYDWTRVNSGQYDPGRVYRYEGGKSWIDVGQPGENRTFNTAASFRGQLYVGGGPENWAVFVQSNDNAWALSHAFPKQGPQRLFPHAFCRFNGKLFTAYPCVYGFDGKEWTYAGLPGPLDTVPTLQTHSMTVYQGALCAGTWPEALVARYVGGEKWQPLGRVGSDGTEVNALTVYNGKLYGGSIPRAEVCRYDGVAAWTSLRRFYSPQGWQPAPPGRAKARQVAEWSRVTSLAVYQGKLFAGIGSCTSAIVDNPADPADVLGKVFTIEAGKNATQDHDLGPGWKHLAAIRDGNRLLLYVDGKRIAQSSTFVASDYDLSVDRPLRLGAGQSDYFSGRLAEARFYRRALKPAEIRRLAATPPPR